ncbi:sigma-70 family RNA polymerase sigma factor [Sutcliffiella horikoshii]|uniref:Sigma-70 family RNA polymerase sigma factor n=1 Tax=Sutcliffiella horikoshii TaxID=79883 RepID=A0AA94WNM3_9BACI|nr:sigma-70 family RNA polymerase sigma factor [Sutcliffiella horikoshii]TYS57373.1 sigma-70 family RNA polymerase sigma factor [Sutcliffiella horikoshii]
MKILKSWFKPSASGPTFESLIKNEQEKLYKIAFAYVKNEQDALDVVQEAVINAYKAFPKLENPQYFSTWMTRILINTAINELRRKKKITFLDIEKHHEQSVKETHLSIHKLDLAEVLERLKPEQRSLLMMRFTYGYSIKEMAQIFEKPEGTIKSQLHRTLAQVKAELEEGGEKYGEA